jgi:hypothetical protein
MTLAHWKLLIQAMDRLVGVDRPPGTGNTVRTTLRRTLNVAVRPMITRSEVHLHVEGVGVNAQPVPCASDLRRCRLRRFEI